MFGNGTKPGTRQLKQNTVIRYLLYGRKTGTRIQKMYLKGAYHFFCRVLDFDHEMWYNVGVENNKEIEMDSNILSTLMYTVMPIVVTIISAIIMRVKWERFEIGDAFRCVLLGVLWPITLVGGAVYLVSGFLCRKINENKEN